MKFTDPLSTSQRNRFAAREVIESFRLGLVPRKYIKEFTFGRDKEVSKIQNWLDTPNSNPLLLVGEYGSGKTHLLQYIYNTIIDDDWMVSAVEVDPNEVPFYRPRKIWGKIRDSLVFKISDKCHNWNDFLKIINKDKLFLENHPIRKNTKYYSYDYYTSANIYCNLVSTLGWCAKNVLNLKGLVILFDEAENLTTSETAYQLDKSWNFFKGLILLAQQDNRLLNEKLESRVEGYFGEETGLQYCGWAKDIRFTWQIPNFVRLIFGFTPITRRVFDRLNFCLPEITLEHLGRETLKEVFLSICNVYSEAYQTKIVQLEKINNYVFNNIYHKLNKTRQFIKAMVEALDLIYFNRSEYINLTTLFR